MRRIIPGLLALVLSLTPVLLYADAGREQAREAAERFAQALRSGEPAGLQAILPAAGRILVALADDGADAAYFAPAQVEALLAARLSGASYTACRVEDLQVQAGSYARVELVARRAVSGGSSAPVRFRLALQAEGERWVLREIRETIR